MTFRPVRYLAISVASAVVPACDGADPIDASLLPSLLENGGFELAGDGDGPAGWFTQNGDAFSLFEWSGDVRRSGERSISIGVRSDALVGSRVYNWSQDIEGGFFDGESFELVGWVRTDNLARTAVVFVRCFAEDPPGPQLCFETTETVVDLSGTHDWTRVGVPFQVAGGTRVLRITMAITRVNRGGRAWFDDFSLVPL